MSNVGVSVGSDLFWIWQMLMIAERFKDGLFSSKDQEMMDKMDRELTKVIEDFDRAVNVEALCQAKGIGKHTLFQSGNSSLSIASYRGIASGGAARTSQGRP